MHAEICPLCKGEGKKEVGLDEGKDIRFDICWGCKGRGWVEVSGDVVNYPSGTFTGSLGAV